MRSSKKVAIVTGAAQGIGRAIALRFAKEGLQTTIADINVEKLREAQNEIQRFGECLSIKVDVSHPHEVEEIVNKVIKEFSRVELTYIFYSAHNCCCCYYS